LIARLLKSPLNRLQKGILKKKHTDYYVFAHIALRFSELLHAVEVYVTYSVLMVLLENAHCIQGHLNNL
jgi:hypothetical protein